METKVFNQAVKRNIDRFPKEFMFQLTKKEYELLRSQFVTTSWGGRRYLPFVFTEQGVSMLSAVLHSKVAINISIQIINPFVQMRRFLQSNQDTFKRLNIVETKLLEYEDNFKELFNALNKRPELSSGIFFEGEFFDSYEFISNLIKKAKKEIKNKLNNVLT
ncbi:MAG: ORF6N domain-containing protein [Candidatus Woesearchaeota archaeon]